MTISLRPHHLLCLLTYVGKGYTPAFTANYDAIAKRLSDGETIAIVDGPDDICAPLLLEKDPHCHSQSVIDRDQQASLDVAEILASPINVGTSLELDPHILQSLRTAFASGRIRKACGGCEWNSLCNTIAGTGYSGTLVNRKRRPPNLAT